jgi:hypothetical protein
VRYGERVRVRGRLTRPDGTPVGGMRLCVGSRADTIGARLRDEGSVATDGRGRFKVRLRPGPSRRVYVVARVPGGAVSDSVMLHVRAPVTLRTQRSQLRNGEVLRFRGRLRAGPIPRRGLLVELQVRKPGSWQTFKTLHTRRKGRFAYDYQFTRTTGFQRFQFRARVPVQTPYPYATGRSRSLWVSVSG